jgi:hypothetical protein
VTADNPLSPEHVTLADTNVFISTGNPGTAKYRRFRTAVTRAGVTLLIPARIEEEIAQSGVEQALEQACDEEWARVVDGPALSQSDATAAQDIARRAIASNSPEKGEHEVEKADTVFAGSAVEYLHQEETGDDVTIVTADNRAQEAITTAVSSLGYEGQIHLVSLWDIISEGDEFRVI